MKDIFEKLITVADQLDDIGYERQADLVDAVVKSLIGDRDNNRGYKETPKKVKKVVKQVNEDVQEIRRKIVDDEDVKDLFDAKAKLTKLKNSDDYELTDDEWAKLYKQILDDKFKREYTEKSEEELEKELNDLTEDKKRKGELTKEEEADYEMIDKIYKSKAYEETRPSDRN